MDIQIPSGILSSVSKRRERPVGLVHIPPAVQDLTYEYLPGWATRLEDSIYAGCIPVFIGSATQHPFWDIFEWSRISVRVAHISKT